MEERAIIDALQTDNEALRAEQKTLQSKVAQLNSQLRNVIAKQSIMQSAPTPMRSRDVAVQCSSDEERQAVSKANVATQTAVTVSPSSSHKTDAATMTEMRTQNSEASSKATTGAPAAADGGREAEEEEEAALRVHNAKRLRAYRTRVHALDAEIARLNAALEEKDRYNHLVLRRLQESAQQIAAKYETQISHLQSQLSECTTENKRMNELEEQNNALTRMLHTKDTSIAALSAQLKERSEQALRQVALHEGIQRESEEEKASLSIALAAARQDTNVQLAKLRHEHARTLTELEATHQRQLQVAVDNANASRYAKLCQLLEKCVEDNDVRKYLLIVTNELFALERQCKLRAQQQRESVHYLQCIAHRECVLLDTERQLQAKESRARLSDLYADCQSLVQMLEHVRRCA